MEARCATLGRVAYPVDQFTPQNAENGNCTSEHYACNHSENYHEDFRTSHGLLEPEFEEANRFRGVEGPLLPVAGLVVLDLDLDDAAELGDKLWSGRWNRSNLVDWVCLASFNFVI